MMTPFSSPSSELTVLGGILKHGRDLLFDVEPLVEPADFQDETNQLIFSSLREYYADEAAPDRVSYAGLLAAARKVGADSHLQQGHAKGHLQSLKTYAAEPSQVRAEAGRLLKLRIARGYYDAAQSACDSLTAVKGDEPLSQIMASAETPIFDYSSRVNGDGNDTRQIGQGVEEWLEDILANPRENLGIPSPFPKYNDQIGGGFRRKSVAMIGARAKAGKTTWVDNVCLHVAGELGIPVFNLDTEMTDEEHWARVLAHLTATPIKVVESGLVTATQAAKLREAAQYLKSIPYYYRSVIDESFEEQVAAMRRWITRTVGVDSQGVRKDALILYDYLQLTDPGEFKNNKFAEYQLLGFQMVALTRLAKKYDIPLVSMLQLNREGIDKETTAVAAGSDRIIWKCSSFSIIKRKTEDEMATDGPDPGNTKLICLIARHGPGAEPGDYIHLKFDRATSKMTEGPTRFELDREGGKKASTQQTFQVDDEPQDIQLDTGT